MMRSMVVVCLVVVVLSVNVAGDHCPKNHPIKGADVRIRGEWTGAAGTADEFVISESEDSSGEDSDDNFQCHKVCKGWFSLIQFESAPLVIILARPREPMLKTCE